MALRSGEWSPQLALVCLPAPPEVFRAAGRPAIASWAVGRLPEAFGVSPVLTGTRRWGFARLGAQEARVRGWRGWAELNGLGRGRRRLSQAAGWKPPGAVSGRRAAPGRARRLRGEAVCQVPLSSKLRTLRVRRGAAGAPAARAPGCVPSVPAPGSQHAAGGVAAGSRAFL